LLPEVMNLVSMYMMPVKDPKCLYFHVRKSRLINSNPIQVSCHQHHYCSLGWITLVHSLLFPLKTDSFLSAFSLFPLLCLSSLTLSLHLVSLITIHLK
jgi:hypothetical protein